VAEASAPVGDSRPLVAFPPPTTGRIPAGDPPRRRPLRGPSPRRQGTRLTPQFDALRTALESERAQLAETTSVADPELVAVFDVAGTVDRFLRAAADVEGLEFLADLREERVEPDDDFFYEAEGDVADDTVPQSLYMVMTNAQAVNELVRLFGLWQGDPSIRFATGLNPLKQVFGLLRSIRRWGPEDRVRETGLLHQWAEEVAVVGAQGTSRVEIELWYRSEESARAQAQSQVAAILAASGGAVIATSVQETIAYHAVLADIPTSEVERVLTDGVESIDLLTTEAIMMVSPTRPMVIDTPEPTDAAPAALDTARPTGRPRVAVLDGVPLGSHVALDGRIVIDDPDDRSALYRTAQRCHGTSMASLIIHGDLADPGQAIRQPLYVRPVLAPHAHFHRREIVPRDELLVDLVHRSFHRIFKGDAGGTPAAPGVRIVNLSVGDPTRVFVRRLSPLARMLDWLAHRYNLVIVVSGGNHDACRPALDAGVLGDRDGAASAAVRSLHQRARQRRLLSPAEAINVVTVGAVHADGVDVELPDTVLDLVPAGAPAPYSPVGFGFRRSVKPEVLLPGGRQIFRAPPPGAAGMLEVEPAETAALGPGVVVAAPGLSGELDAVTHACGTSNAAALATRSLNAIIDVLEGLTVDESTGLPFPDAQYHPVLAKTLLVHAAGWHDLIPTMRDALGLSGHAVRRELTQLLGYGPVRGERLATADRVRVVLLGAGSIDRDQRHSFRFPLPTALSASRDWRRLTITLGWLSPVNVRSQKYRTARLQFSPPLDDLALRPVEADHAAVLKGTVQHQVLEGDAAVAFVEGSELAIDVDCRSDGGSFPAPVRFGIAASLEVSPTVRLDIHRDVVARLRQLVRDRTRAQVPAR
jgi:hypothetical protein